MPDTSTQPPNDATGDRTSFVADVRARLMEDLAPVEIIAEALGKSPRTHSAHDRSGQTRHRHDRPHAVCRRQPRA